MLADRVGEFCCQMNSIAESEARDQIMDATAEVTKLLHESGAVLVRQNKHLVYQLPNRRTFTRSKTPSDNRAALNELSDLRRALGRERPAPMVPKEDQTEMSVATPCPQPAAGPDVVQEVPSQSLKERIEATILDEESSQEKLLAAAQGHERRVQMLKALLPFANDPATEGSLRTLLPAPPQTPELVAAKPSEPPQQIVERVQVTRQLVFAATQTFEGRFTVNDVMDLMTGGKQIEGKERLRVRQAIAAAMVSLQERGELRKVEDRYGRSQSVWQRAELNGKGQSNGAQA